MVSLLILLTIAALTAGFLLPKRMTTPSGNSDLTSAKWTLKGVGVVLAFVATAFASYYQVPTGYVGILLQQGAVHGMLEPGPHFVVPYVQTVEQMEVRTQKEEAQAAAASRDLQNVTTQVAVNHHVDPRQAQDLYSKVGINYTVRIIDPAVQEIVKAVVARYTAEELIRNRAQVKDELDRQLADRLKPWGIMVEAGGISLKDFQFSQAFNEAIEQKQVAQQTAEKAKYLLQQADTDAKTKITTAKGEAEAARIRANAFNASGGSKVLAQQWIEKWDGKLPTVSGGNSNMLIDVRSLMDEAKK